MRLKSMLSVITAMAITLSLSACGSTEPTAAEATTTAATTAAATTAAETKPERTTEAEVKAETEPAAAVAPEIMTAETIAAEPVTSGVVYPEVTITDYTGIAMVEIIELGTDNDEFSPAMTEMNIDIMDNVIERYEESVELFNASGEDAESYMGGIDINAYSFTDDNYIQIYNTVLNTPTYGTAGDLFGFVYDIQNDNYITVGEYLSDNGKTEYDIMNEVAELAHEQYPDDYIGEITVKGFNLSKGPDGEYVTAYLVEMEKTAPEAGEPHKGFYSYTPYNNELMEMNGTQLFDPSSVDEFDPPIRSQESFDYDQLAVG